MKHFLTQFTLYAVAFFLKPFAEMATFFLVWYNYGKGVLNYFDRKGYQIDVQSASEHRILWNKLLVKKGGYMFAEGTKKSISRHIGINKLLGKQTKFSKALCRFLNLFDKNHCINSLSEEDFELIKHFF